MIRLVILFAIAVLSSSASAEEIIEIDGLFGECRAVLAAKYDSLVLHESPRSSSSKKSILYRAGWAVPYTKRDGKTLILRIGELRIASLGGEYLCSDEFPTADTIEIGDTIDYLHYLGEGFARVRIDDAICDTNVDESSEYIEVIRQPEIQVWIRVLYADGSTPGWLLDDASQTRVAGVEC